MDGVKVSIEVEVNPTEDLDKVKEALHNLFAYPTLECIPRDRGSLLIMNGDGEDGLNKFYFLLRQERILDAARKAMLRGLKENSIVFYLNKQVAYVKRISLCSPVGESPLGSIRVEIICDNPRELIDWLAPRTS